MLRVAEGDAADPLSRPQVTRHDLQVAQSAPWLTGPGFCGCNTLPELVAFLKQKLTNAKRYADKRIETNVLLVNFALKKWFLGHVKATGAGAVTRIVH